jgi:hypothetical protein
LIDDLRPRLLPAALIIAAAFILFVVGNGAYWLAFGLWMSRLALLGIPLFLGAFWWAWHVADPITGADKPRIERRRE